MNSTYDPNQGLTWVLLRGLGRDSRHWMTFPQLMGNAFPQSRLVCLDLPGNGALCNEESPKSIKAAVESYRQQLLDLEIPPPYSLCALSMGGMVALEWLHRYPDEILHAVVINTSTAFVNPFFKRLRPFALLRLLRAALAGVRRKEAEVFNLTTNMLADSAGIVATWQSFADECPVSTRNLLRQIFAAARYSLRDIDYPERVMVVNSARDELVHPRCGRDIARKWELPHYVHPEAGHDLPLDDPSWLIFQIKEWLDVYANKESWLTASDELHNDVVPRLFASFKQEVADSLPGEPRLF